MGLPIGNLDDPPLPRVAHFRKVGRRQPRIHFAKVHDVIPLVFIAKLGSGKVSLDALVVAVEGRKDNVVAVLEGQVTLMNERKVQFSQSVSRNCFAAIVISQFFTLRKTADSSQAPIKMRQSLAFFTMSLSM